MYKIEDFKFIGTFEAGERKRYGVIEYAKRSTAYAPLGDEWVELDSTTGKYFRTIGPGDNLCDFLNENRPAITDAATVRPELRAEDFEYIGKVADPEEGASPWPHCYRHKPTGRRFAQLSTRPRELDESGRGTTIEDVALLGILEQVDALELYCTKPVQESEPESEPEPAYSRVTAFSNALRVELAQRVSALSGSAVRFTEAGADPARQLAAADELLAFQDVINRLEALHNEA